MKTYVQNENGSAILCAMCAILVLSVIAANVLLNCTTRYNVTAKQVNAWRDALVAAEAGGDIAFARLHPQDRVMALQSELPCYLLLRESNGFPGRA